MNLRMIKQKTGVEIKLQDITACHVMPGTPHTWVLRVANRAPDSGLESLCAGMYTGKKLGTDDYFENNGVYINFMVTKSRSKLLQQVREVRKGNKNLLPKFSVNQNGRITVLLKRIPPTPWGQPREKETWEVVEEVKDLQRLFPNKKKNTKIRLISQSYILQTKQFVNILKLLASPSLVSFSYASFS